MPLSTFCVLIVEDEPIVAMLAEDMIESCGGTVASGGAVDTVAAALRLLDEMKIDVGMLDVNLNGERSYPIAHEMRRRGIPFVFVSGYHTLDDEAPENSPLVQKPYSSESICRAMTEAMSG